jgi:hypothetical protein
MKKLLIISYLLFNINTLIAGTASQCPVEIEAAEYILPSVANAGESIKFGICHRANYFILGSSITVNENSIDLFLARHSYNISGGITPVFNESLFILDQGLDIGSYNINLYESVLSDVVGSGGPFLVDQSQLSVVAAANAIDSSSYFSLFLLILFLFVVAYVFLKKHLYITH